VMLPPGCAIFAAKPLPIGSDTPVNTMGIVLVCPRFAGKGGDHGRGHTQDCIGPQIDQLFCQSPHPIRITGAPAKFDPEIAAFSPPQLRERTQEHCEPRLRNPIALRIAHQHADQPHPVRLLRTCRKRPCSRAAKQRDELSSLQPVEMHPTAPLSYAGSRREACDHHAGRRCRAPGTWPCECSQSRRAQPR
jgi:hypothetical protein